MRQTGRDTPATSRRETFRHGDLRRALVEAGVEMARAGGPQAVVLREATRRAGVVPNAAYRHFGSQAELLAAVRSAALAALAAAIEAEMAKVQPGAGPADDAASHARQSLSAVGAAYMRFARREPGLFRTAFSVPAPVFEPPNPANAGPGGLNPFQLLGVALDRMVEAGVLARENRPGAEFLAWSAVHGMVLLILDGPLTGIADDAAELLGARLLRMVEQGLS